MCIRDRVVTVCDVVHEELDAGADWWHWSIPDPVDDGTAKAFDAVVAELDERIAWLVDDCARRGLVPANTTPHTLRHTFATHYLKDHPGDIVGLAALLGHSSLETTRIYVQPSAEDLAQRVEQTRLNAYR